MMHKQYALHEQSVMSARFIYRSIYLIAGKESDKSMLIRDW